MTNLPEPSLIEASGFKGHIKKTWTRLLRDMFAAEEDWKFTMDLNAKGLKVMGRYPNAESTLPWITVGMRGVTGQRLSLNRTLGHGYRDASQIEGTGSNPQFHARDVQGFSVKGFMEFDIFARSDDERDRLIDRVVDFLIWRDVNKSGLDAYDELARRWIKYDPSNFGTRVDQEAQLGEGYDICRAS